jgi:hypothetical protein
MRFRWRCSRNGKETRAHSFARNETPTSMPSIRPAGISDSRRLVLAGALDHENISVEIGEHDFCGAPHLVHRILDEFDAALRGLFI